MPIDTSITDIQTFSPGDKPWGNPVQDFTLGAFLKYKGNALGFVTSEPASPNENDIYIINDIPAIYSVGQWHYYTPHVGWKLYVLDGYYQWDGASWAIETEGSPSVVRMFRNLTDYNIPVNDGVYEAYTINGVESGMTRVRIDIRYDDVFGEDQNDDDYWSSLTLRFLTDGTNNIDFLKIASREPESYFSAGTQTDWTMKRNVSVVVELDIPADATFLKINMIGRAQNRDSGFPSFNVLSDIPNILHKSSFVELINLNAGNGAAYAGGAIPISDVIGLQSALDDRALNAHQHTEADITDLDKYTQAEVDTKDAALQAQIDNIINILNSDDTTLDELQEIVDFIKQNKADLDTLTVSNIAGLQALLDAKLEAVNLAYTASPTGGTVTNDAGDNADISLANDTNAGLMSPDMLSSLNNKVDKVSGKSLSTEDYKSHFITSAERWYLEADGSWVTSSSELYGTAPQNASTLCGTNAAPELVHRQMGELVCAGNIIKNLHFAYRFNASDVSDVELYIVARTPALDWNSAVSSNADFNDHLLYNGLLSGLAGSNDFIGRRKVTIDLGGYVMPKDGELSIYMRPIGSMATRRYLFVNLAWEII